MRRRPSLRWPPRLATLATTLALVVMVVGALVWFRPYLTRKQVSVSEVAAPAALSAASQLAVPPGQQACMEAVAVEPDSLAAQMAIARDRTRTQATQSVELVIQAPGYRSVSHVETGRAGGIVTAPVSPPPRPVLATACFVNRGATTLTLEGSDEPRTVSRSPTTVQGVSVVGDISLTFLDTRPRSLLGQLGTVFGHASNLTDHLIPVWLVWVIALLAAFGVPIGVLTALHWGLSEDEAPAEG